VVIINPDFVDVYNPTEEDYDKVQSWLMIKKSGENCPHMKWDGDTAICLIHHMKWFLDTPCGKSQVESRNSECRIGAHNRKMKINVKEMCYVVSSDT